MSATGHKRLSVTFLNLHHRNVSILIVTFLFITYVLCQAAWEQREGHPDTVTGYCCLHHPQYKYQIVIDRSGVSKKSLSSNPGCKMSVDTNATIAEIDNNVIE
jgi:hypothetical protein